MPNHFRAAIMFAWAPVAIAAAQSARPATTDVPVAKVVLFSSGVGYFEHAGTARGNGTTELRFKTSQINDILKSIMLQDQDGGRVGAITYPSQDPLAKTLKSFQVDITQNPSQAELLNQLRGAQVTIQVRGATIAGTILGVETRRLPADKGEPVAQSVLNLLTGATIRSVELQSISSLSLEDPQLQDELTKALAALAQARDQDKKPVTISFVGAGDRRVRIGYVVETPIWKTSYRLLLDDKGTSAKLQGWAIVENQTESDWHGVSLSLVSGRPISFMMDLYQPLYATRPTVVSEFFNGLRPQLYEGGLTTDNARPAAAPAVQRRDMLQGRAFGSSLNEMVTTGMAVGSTVTPFDMTSSVKSIAETAKLGELFQYTVPNVTLARQKSAMLPIITDSVELERLSIFNASALASNPLNGVWLKNTTGKHLQQGPVTVLDGGGYAGDARVDNVPPGQTRLLSYGVDLEMAMKNGTSMTSAVVSSKLSKGMLTLSRRLLSSQSYDATNKSAKDKVLLVEHPIRQGWRLVDTKTPFETTPSHYRFKATVAANKTLSLVVKEEIVQGETVAMLPMDLGQLVTYSKNGEISKEVRDTLGKAIQLKQGMFDLDRQITAAGQQIAGIAVEQARIRENWKSISAASQ
ncbi:MAG: hypothetical protein ABJE47_16815 [bacterium]